MLGTDAVCPPLMKYKISGAFRVHGRGEAYISDYLWQTPKEKATW
jgi:hypothetical protein